MPVGKLLASAPAPSSLLAIKGVGPHRIQLLEQIGIRTPIQLLNFLPRGHQDRRIRLIRDLKIGEKGALRAEVLSHQYKQVGPQLGLYRALLKDSSGTLEALWFKHLTYKFDVFSGVKKTIQQGRHVYVFGSVEAGKMGAQFRVEDHAAADADQAVAVEWNRIWPIYPSVEGLSDRWFRDIISRVFTDMPISISDPLPGNVRASHELIEMDAALRNYHFPETWVQRDKARERLAFDEFFFLDLALMLSRRNHEKKTKGFVSRPTKKYLTPFKSKLGFQFTKAQVRSINEIFQDMAKPTPMYRLLQGDVGSGKTCVALSACLLSIENGRQAAVLAPTEILADQHVLLFEKFLAGLKVRVGRLKGGMKSSERKKVLEQLKKGDIDLVVGTHALLNEDVVFFKLGIVVIDEQHRFGVRQRAKIIQKARSSAAFQDESLIEAHHPDVLIMTATPIPRTLALTLYGDLDVSLMDENPPGRAPISTRIESESRAWEALRQTVERGEQVYVVLPLIDDTSTGAMAGSASERKSVLKQHETLTKLFPDYHIGLLHGRLSSEEKQKTMDAFRANRMQVVVTTTVIEVGVDVPNATLMIILNPERFGLAQLHQLRGRVGRGLLKSTCILVPQQFEETESFQRLSMFSAITNGFQLAEEDLKLRGPGEIMGEAQHGVPFFKVGNLVSDGILIHAAKKAVRALLSGTIQLSLTEHENLNETLHSKFGDRMSLSQVG